jgi:methylmalonyl-CoA carboxyltransferase 12S subunit
LGPLLLLPLSALVGYLAGQYATRNTLRRQGGAAPAEPQPAAPAPQAAPVAPAAPAPVVPEEITPDVLIVLTAAVSAFLGKKAKIRGARLMRPAQSNAWAQQGRVFVQASHALPHRSR